MISTSILKAMETDAQLSDCSEHHLEGQNEVNQTALTTLLTKFTYDGDLDFPLQAPLTSAN